MRAFLFFISPILVMLFFVQYYPYNKMPVENQIICDICESISGVVLGLLVTSYIFQNKNGTMYKIHMLLDPPVTSGDSN